MCVDPRQLQDGVSPGSHVSPNGRTHHSAGFAGGRGQCYRCSPDDVCQLFWRTALFGRVSNRLSEKALSTTARYRGTSHVVQYTTSPAGTLQNSVGDSDNKITAIKEASHALVSGMRPRQQRLSRPGVTRCSIT